VFCGTTIKVIGEDSTETKVSLVVVCGMVCFSQANLTYFLHRKEHACGSVRSIKLQITDLTKSDFITNYKLHVVINLCNLIAYNLNYCSPLTASKNNAAVYSKNLHVVIEQVIRYQDISSMS